MTPKFVPKSRSQPLTFIGRPKGSEPRIRPRAGDCRFRRGAVISTSSPLVVMLRASQAHARKRSLPDESEIQRRDDAGPAARLLLAVLLLELPDRRLSSVGVRRHVGQPPGPGAKSFDQTRYVVRDLSGRDLLKLL